jgi:PAS domain S-box-containing protein
MGSHFSTDPNVVAQPVRAGRGISKVKRSQSDNFKALLTNQARYQLLVDAVTDYAIYMLDAEGYVVSWNSGAQRLKGYSAKEIVGCHFSRFYPEADVRAGMPARTLATAAHEGRFEAEGWRIRKGGDRFWAHVVVDPVRSPVGELLGFAKVTRDLSERRNAEESLHRSEEQFRLLVQGVTDYAIYMLDPNGIVTSWNVGAQRIKGYLPEEIIGSHFSRFYRPEDRERGQPQATLATAEREGRFEAEGWRVRKDGSHFWANVVVDPIRDDEGRIIGFAKVTRDVTEKHNNQLALERAREALFQSQKLEAVGQLTGGVAHDFNNLLMVVLSSLELLRKRVPDDAALKRLIDNAAQGAKRGVTLTQRMLAFARRQELKPFAVDVRSLVHGMKDLIERSVDPTIEVFIDLPTELPPILIDANQLELAILNLVVNARDAMPDGGSVRITARREAVDAATGGLAPGFYICLAIADSGSGMNQETLARATEPFFTTKGSGKGTGLGLPMVYGLAVQSGGNLVLSSAEGQGTTAELWLPVAAADAAKAQGIAATQESRPELAPMHMVAVDDDPLVLAGTVSMLEDLGHSVLAAASGRQALELVLGDSRVAMVITDQVMPGMTGAELAARLRAERPGLPIVLVSGFGEIPSGLDHMTLRLAKPFDRPQLSDAIGKACEADRRRLRE